MRGVDEVTYRNPNRCMLLVMTGVVLLIALDLGSISAAVSLVALWAGFGLLVARPSVSASSKGLVVTNFFRTRSIRWPDVAVIRAGDWKNNAGPVCEVRLHSGEVVRAWALYGGRNGFGSATVHRCISELEQRHALEIGAGSAE